MNLLNIKPLSGSDVVEVPFEPPKPPVISDPKPSRSRQKSRSLSPIPADGAGDVLSIEETNKLRAKLGLKPLEVGSSDVTKTSSGSSNKKDENEEKDPTVGDLKKIKDDWGEFYHKPAGQFNEKTEAELLREKIQAKRDKRKIEEKLARIKTLGESDSEDDASAWVNKSRKIEIDEKKKAAERAKMLEEMDENLDQVTTHVRRRPQKSSKQNYGEKDLTGLKVAHDIEEFTEDRQVILTLEDKDVLADDGDTLMNVNMKDNERYKKNVVNKKLNPQHYGYDVFEDQYDDFGNFIGRGVLAKYDEEIDGNKKSTFTIGESKELIQQQQRRALEVKAKLQNKTLESLNIEPLKLASDHYTEEEMTKFKKPKKKVKKLRKQLKADDLLEIVGDASIEESKDLGSRNRREGNEKPKINLNAGMLPSHPEEEDLSSIKIEPVDEDQEYILSKAKRIKQNEIIKKEIPIETIKTEVKMETEEDSEEEMLRSNNHIILNQTAEFCRTLGDIPTYGMAGNRDEATDMMDLEENDDDEEMAEKRGKWNQVDPNEEPKLVEGIPVPEPEEVVVLDEEPDIALSMANALKLAMSKGYLEKEDSNKPSNTRFAHIQAQHYSIEDKAYGEDDKYSRRGGGGSGYNGPLSEFREKSGYKPNVKLEYIDDNNQKLTPKEAFRYLSHKFHGKGPGKNKIEKRLKKMEQEGVICCRLVLNFQKF